MVNPEVPAFPRVLPSKRVGTKAADIESGHKALDSTEGGLILIVVVKIGPGDIDTNTDSSKRDQESYSMELLLVHKVRISIVNLKNDTYPSEEKPMPIVNLDLFFPGLSPYSTPPLLEEVKRIPVASQE
ncbi:hypothetical protein M9H77_23694 [Catharanthus roseus]|uniref:Uncharacterized protein n=1 Tax=Catharanthus roseus TaxID=4058 RepID=A0ACC0AUT3_CATRO|nr:hypothetical protein M9H77_00003 [Catharanthus roseus]KAI5664371.1 hypothetical protein M9H77_23694 [Catharanthus roseus]